MFWRVFESRHSKDPKPTSLVPRQQGTASDLILRDYSPDRERISFVSVVNDFDEAKHNLFASSIAKSTHHEWIIINNVQNNLSKNICELYVKAQNQASNDLVFFLHQDVYLPDEWEECLYRSLTVLEATDPEWGILGAVGMSPGDPATLFGHWSDPHFPETRRVGPPPCEVFCLDELWLGIRKQRNISFDPHLPGFHCYGVDLSLTARTRGLRTYAMDAPTRHKFKDSSGRRIMNPAGSAKIQARETAEFKAAAQISKDYVGRKWRTRLPFRSTSMVWNDRIQDAPALHSASDIVSM